MILSKNTSVATKRGKNLIEYIFNNFFLKIIKTNTLNKKVATKTFKKVILFLVSNTMPKCMVSQRLFQNKLCNEFFANRVNIKISLFIKHE